MTQGRHTTPSDIIEVHEGDYVVLDDGWSVLASEEFELSYERRLDPLNNFVAIPGKIDS